MSKLTIIDKLKILFDVSIKSYISIIALIVLILIGVLFATTNKRTVERNKNIYIFGTAGILALLIVLYFQSLSNMFDYMMNNLFIAIYFPNLAIYFAALIIMNIIIWVSLFNYKTSEIIKKINLVIYVIMNYFLVLILTTINKEKLDIFSQESIYKNSKATALIELSSVIFIIWIIYLILYKIIMIYLKKDYKPKLEEVIFKESPKKLPDNFEPVDSPKIIYGNIPKQKEFDEELEKIAREITIEKEKEYNMKLEVLNRKRKELVIRKEELKRKKEELEKEKQRAKAYDSLLTIEDYKVLLKILKNQKNKSIKRNTNDIREAQKQEIIRLEEERRESLRKEKERLKKQESQKNGVPEIDLLFGDINKLK